MSIVKQLGIVGLLGLLAAGGYVGWQQFAGDRAGAQEAGARRGGGGPAVETAKAELRDLETAIDAVGTTRARRSVEITPLATGQVTEIGFRAGKQVRQGDVLLRLDSDIQRADLIEAEARLKEAASALNRAQSLRQSRAIATATVDKLISALATAQADHERATRRLRDRTVTAPFSGIVGYSRVELGTRIEDGDPVTMLDDLSLVEIEFAVPEGLYGRISPGQRVVADATAFPGRTFAGTIETIDSRIDPVSRAFKVRAVVANADHALPAGMYMHLAVVLATHRALTVPEEAIVLNAGQATVFAIVARGAGLVAERRDVTVGKRAFGHVEILSGVEAGEDIVTRGVQKVRDGRPVRRAGRPAGNKPKPEAQG